MGTSGQRVEAHGPLREAKSTSPASGVPRTFLTSVCTCFHRGLRPGGSGARDGNATGVRLSYDYRRGDAQLIERRERTGRAPLDSDLLVSRRSPSNELSTVGSPRRWCEGYNPMVGWRPPLTPQSAWRLR